MKRIFPTFRVMFVTFICLNQKSNCFLNQSQKCSMFKDLASSPIAILISSV